MNPLAIRIAADLKAFKANMAEMRVQLETNQAAMKRMASAFDGNKVIGDANAMVKAIHEIGGASKLTDTEMKRVNSTVTEALAKYKALGREAPPELLALRDATSKVHKPMQDLGDSSTSLIGKLKGVAGALGLAFGAAAVVSGIKSLISNTFEYAETIKDTSAKLGISMEATQRYQFAAEQTGASLENVSKSVLKLSQGLAGGDKGLKEALTVSGLEFDKLRAMKPEDAFNSVAEAVMKIPDPMLQAKLMLELFGKSGVELLPALRDGFLKLSDGVKTMSDETINRLDAAKDTWSEFGRAITIVSGEVLANAGEGFKRFFVFLEMLRTQGPVAAEQWRLAMIQADKTITELSNSSKLAAAALQKKGETVQQIAKYLGVTEKSVQAYLDTLKKAPPILRQFGDENKKAAKVVKESWSGTDLTNDPFGYGQIIALEIERGIKANPGETLQELLARRWQLGKSFSGSVTGDVFGYGEIIALEVERGITAARGETLEQLLARRWGMGKSFGGASASELSGGVFWGEGEKAGRTFLDAFAKSMENLGTAIVGAIQGGGNVILAGVASLAQSVGSHFAAKFAAAAAEAGTGAAAAQLAGSMVSGIIGVGLSIINDMLKPSYTALEQLSRKYGRSVEEVTAQLRNMGAAGVKAFQDMTRTGGSWADMLKSRFGGMSDADAMLGLLDQFQTKEELDKIAIQWKSVYDYMLSSGKYTAAQLAEAWKQYESAQKAAIGAIDPEDARPVGARGFPTKAQLQQAVKEAEEAYLYVRDSGLYTADVIEQAWQQWQDAMIASGDETSKRMKALTEEINSLQQAVEAETPEYDANGVRIYGVEELRNIERLQALEAEKHALIQKQLDEEMHATEEAAKKAALQADKEFEAAKVNAKNLDSELRLIFSKGYDVPIRFLLPNGLPTSGGLPSGGSPFGQGAPLPTLPSRASSAPLLITVVSQMDGREVARNQVKYIPKELAFVGARR